MRVDDLHLLLEWKMRQEIEDSYKSIGGKKGMYVGRDVALLGLYEDLGLN